MADHDRRFLMEQNPYPEPQCWYHGTLKYNRRLYGRYGQASGVNPSICWPIKEELADTVEYERVAYPFTIPQMIQTKAKERQEKKEKRIQRQNEIVEKMKKLDGWIHEMQSRIAKKETEVKAAKVKFSFLKLKSCDLLLFFCTGKKRKAGGRSASPLWLYGRSKG